VQITDGTSQLTNTNFALDKVIPEKDSKKFKTSPFSDFLTLDDLKEETNAPTTQTSQQIDQEVKFRGSKDNAAKSLFGSLKSRLSVSISRIIGKFPAALYVDSNRPISASPYSATDITFDLNLKTTEFTVEESLLFNPFDVVLRKPKSNIIPETDNEIRNLFSSFTKYVIDISGTTYEIVNYIEPNSVNKFKIKVKGFPFGNVSGYSGNYLIRPNDALTEEFFNGLDDLEEILLNRETNPKYNAPFKVPRDSSDGSKISLTTVEYNWPITIDGWNLQISGIKYDEYITNLIDVADEIDDYKSNLFVRFMASPQLFEFDTDDQKTQSVFQLYGQSFDQVKKYIDNIAYMRNVSYDGINNLPDVLLKNLSNTLGLSTTNLFDEKSIDDILYKRTDTQFKGLSIGKTLVDAEYEFYRRILVNLAYIYKSKGTRSSIEFFLKFLGAPEPMIKFDEYVYKVIDFPNSFDIQSDIYNVLLGTKTHITAVFDPTGYTYTKSIITASTSFDRDGYPVEEGTGYPRKAYSESADIFFEKGSGWYDITLDHRSPDILDTENSITTGRTKTLKTKSKVYTYGEDYFDVFRTLPGLDTGYELEQLIDNRKVELIGDNSPFILNRKNISIYLSSAQVIDYDIYRKSRDLTLTFGTTTLYPQTGVTFAEFLQKMLSDQIKNSNTIKYKKNYIVLEDVFRDYITRTSFTPYHFIDVNEFINKMSPYWTQMLDQFIPATTQWTGGDIIENGIFGRPKYPYKFGCQPKVFIETLYPDFKQSIDEDLETLLGDDDNLRGLINLTGVTYYPVIEIDGETYGGPGYWALSSNMTVVVSGTTNTSHSAQLFDPFPMTGCTSLVSNDTSKLALICDYKDYINPDITKIKQLWVSALTTLINHINSLYTMNAPGCISTYQPYVDETDNETCPQVPKPIITYQFFTDTDCVEKIRFTSIKYDTNDCSVNNYLEYKFSTEYETTNPVCDLEVDISTVCNVYSGGTEDNCDLISDIYIRLTGGTVNIQKGGTGWPIYMYTNCKDGKNQMIDFRNTTQPDITFYEISGTPEQCVFLVKDVKEHDVIDFLITDAANCDLKFKIEGLGLKAEHDPYDPQKSHYQEFYISSIDSNTGLFTDVQTGVTWCDNYTGYTIYPKVQYRNSFNYGLKNDTYVLILSGATIDSGTTGQDIITYLNNGTIIEKEVQDLVAGDILLTALYLDCNSFSNQQFKDALISDDYSFTYEYTTSVISDIECLGSVKKSLITGTTITGTTNRSGSCTSVEFLSGTTEVFEVLPTTKFRVYTKKEILVDGQINDVIVTRDSFFFDTRIPENLQVKPNQIEPCCDHSSDYYQNGDFLITREGGLIEVIAVDLDYCDSGIYYNINIVDGAPHNPENLILFNGNGSEQVLLQHKYVQFSRVDMNEQQYYVDVENCPVIPTIEDLTRPEYGTTCDLTPLYDCDPCDNELSNPNDLSVCLYNMLRSPDYVIENMFCNTSGVSAITFTMTTFKINGVEQITGTTGFTTTFTSGTTLLMDANNFVVSGCTNGNTTGLTYTNFVDFLNYVFSELGLIEYVAQISTHMNTISTRLHSSKNGFYIIRPTSDTFEFEISSDYVPRNPTILRYTESTVEEISGHSWPEYKSVCDGLNLCNGLVVETGNTFNLCQLPEDIFYSQSSVNGLTSGATYYGMNNNSYTELYETGTDNGSLEWIQIDLLSEYEIKQVVIGSDYGNTLNGGWTEFYTENKDVEYSNDGITWTYLFNTGMFTQGIQTYNVNVSARYLRITSENEYLSVTEFYPLLLTHYCPKYYQVDGGRGMTSEEACDDSINCREYYSTCSKTDFGVGCYIYVDMNGTPLTGYPYVWIESVMYEVDPLTGQVTGISSTLCLPKICFTYGFYDVNNNIIEERYYTEANPTLYNNHYTWTIPTISGTTNVWSPGDGSWWWTFGLGPVTGITIDYNTSYTNAILPLGPWSNSTGGGNMLSTSTSECPNYLELTFTSKMEADLLVGDSTDVNDWNSYFDLPLFGVPFTGVTVVGNTMRLKGGSGITIKPELFKYTSELLKVYDYIGCVIKLDNESFYDYSDNGSLLEVYFPEVTEAVTTLGSNGVFDTCYGLTYAYLPKLVTIGDKCFMECSDLSDLTLPWNQITTLGDYTFSSCNSLTGTIQFENVTTVGDFCFYSCNSLTTLNFHNLISAGIFSFSSCGSIDSFYLPLLTTAGDYCFSYSTSNTPNSFDAPLLTSAGDSCFFGDSFVPSFNLPSLVTADNNCFNYCYTTTGFSLPSLTTAGDSCFANCTGVYEYNLPLLSTAGQNCFVNSFSMTGFSLPSLLTAGNNCFQNSNIVVTFELPKLTNIGNLGFAQCKLSNFFYMPLCTNIGTTVGDDSVFQGITGNTIFLEVAPSCYTSNSGNPDGDIQWLASNNTLLSPTILFDFYSETYYNNGDGSVIDLSGNGNNGIPVSGTGNGIPTTIDGTILNFTNNPGLLIDNASASQQRAIRLPDFTKFTGLTPYTVCVWFNSNILNSGGYQGLVAAEGRPGLGGINGWYMTISKPTTYYAIQHTRFSGGTFGGTSCNLEYGVDITPPFSGDTWYFAVVGFDGTNMHTSLYANDGNRYDNVVASSIPLTAETNWSSFLGLRYNNWFNGELGLMYVDNTWVGYNATDVIYNGTKGRYGY
jgi:hypothetical protein